MNDALASYTGDENTGGVSLKDAGKQVLESVFGDTHDEMERENVVNDLLDTKLLRSKNDVSRDFNRDVMFKRLRKYTDFIVSNKLRGFLGEVEDKLTETKKQGSESEIDRRLKELNHQVDIFFLFLIFLPFFSRSIVSVTYLQIYILRLNL